MFGSCGMVYALEFDYGLRRYAMVHSKGRNKQKRNDSGWLTSLRHVWRSSNLFRMVFYAVGVCFIIGFWMPEVFIRIIEALEGYFSVHTILNFVLAKE